ncbi:MAG: hypothetical protein GOV00_01965, partial [Candidatus Altiarchaeota archaeon]|nr:hypothetical protein [Candidatus Altiarchaeota archaeon]
AFDELEPFTMIDYNQSVVGRNSTSVAFLMFNTGYIPDVYVYDIASTDSITTMDIDSDGRDELILTDSNGYLKVYKVNLTATPILEEVDYLGDFDATAITTNGTNLVLYNGDLIELNSAGFTNGNASLKMYLGNTYPLAIYMNVTLTGSGNVSADLQVGSWTDQSNFTAGTSQNLIFYPEVNGNVSINFTFTGYNSSWDIASEINVTIHSLNTSMGNVSSYVEFIPRYFNPNTTLLANLNYTLVAANFTDGYSLRSIWIYLSQSGTLEMELNSPIREKWLWKPTITSQVSTYNFGQGVVQASQSDSNFTAPVMLNTSFAILPQNITYNTYGVLSDLCAYDDYILAVWGNATLYRWTGSALTEVGNLTPSNLEQCWLSDYIYVMNSSGALDAYNYSLGLDSNFTNSSFIVSDFFVESTTQKTVWAWNGTDLATLDFSTDVATLIQGIDFSFTQQSQIVSGATTSLWGDENVTTHNAFSFDWIMDKLWVVVNKGIWIIKETFSKVVNLPWGSYSGFKQNITVGFTNGTLFNFEFNLYPPSIGSINNFVTNKTYTGAYLAMNTSEVLGINMTASGYYHNETDSLIGFDMNCINATDTQEILSYTFTKGYFHNFTLATNTSKGTYDCEIFPTWEVALPKTMGNKEFILYSDDANPVINSITVPQNISSSRTFNVTVNVTEDTQILSFDVETSNGTASVTDFWKLVSEPFQIFTVGVNLVYAPTYYNEKVNISITVKDVVGRVNTSVTSSDIFIYDAAAPSITLSVPDPRFALENIPINVTISISSDANISFVNATLWDGSSVDSYDTSFPEDKNVTLLWFNGTGLSSTEEFELWVNVTDITGNTRTDSINFKRYSKKTVAVTGHWLDSAEGEVVTYTWEEVYIDTARDAYTYVYNDTDTSTATINTISLDTASIAVDLIKLRNIDSSDYIELRWVNAIPENLKEYVQRSGYVYGLNISVEPDNMYLREYNFNIGSGERMLLKKCDNFTVSSMVCGDSWVTIAYAPQGDTTYTFIVDNSDVTDWTTGVGFLVTKETVVAESSDDAADTTTTTVAAGTASITLTRPNSKTIDVGDCETARFTISNVGTASASITNATATGFTHSEMTFTVISPPSFPITVTAGSNKNLDFSFCPLVVDDFSARVCIKVSGVDICKTLVVIGENASAEGAATTTEENVSYDNLKMVIDDQDGVFVVTIDSDGGVVEGATIQVTYPDGTVENYTTNSLGKASFTPLDEKFTVKMFFEDETLQKKINTSASQLTLGRVLIDLLLLAILMGIGIFLDERLA